MMNGTASVSGGGVTPRSGGASASEAEGFSQLLNRGGGTAEVEAQAQEEIERAVGEGLTQLGLSMMARLGNELIREIKEAERED